MRRLSLPGGRWRSLLPGALLFTCFLSLGVLPEVSRFLEAFGAGSPLRVTIAASPWWAGVWLFVGLLGVLASVLMRRSLGAHLLAMTTVLSLGAAAFTLWSALAVAPHPIGVVCCLCGPIK